MPQHQRYRPLINVTKDHIANSIGKSSSHCMIAEAVRTALPYVTRVSVDIQTIRYTDQEKGVRITFLTPRIAQEAIIDFDDGVLPKPFSFGLRGAHVREIRQLSEEKKKKMRKYQAKYFAKLSRSSHAVPDVYGGKSPPVSRFARVRQFGLKAFIRRSQESSQDQAEGQAE